MWGTDINHSRGRMKGLCVSLGLDMALSSILSLFYDLQIDRKATLLALERPTDTISPMDRSDKLDVEAAS
jgi:hypothetical protein